MEMSAQKLGDFLRDARMSKGYSQKRVADLMRTDQGYISKVEAGKENPNKEFLIDLAEVLSLVPGDLFNLYAGKVETAKLNSVLLPEELTAEDVRFIRQLIEIVAERRRLLSATKPGLSKNDLALMRAEIVQRQLEQDLENKSEFETDNN